MSLPLCSTESKDSNLLTALVSSLSSSLLPQQSQRQQLSSLSSLFTPCIPSPPSLVDCQMPPDDTFVIIASVIIVPSAPTHPCIPSRPPSLVDCAPGSPPAAQASRHPRPNIILVVFSRLSSLFPSSGIAVRSHWATVPQQWCAAVAMTTTMMTGG